MTAGDVIGATVAGIIVLVVLAAVWSEVIIAKIPRPYGELARRPPRAGEARCEWRKSWRTNTTDQVLARADPTEDAYDRCRLQAGHDGRCQTVVAGWSLRDEPDRLTYIDTYGINYRRTDPQ